MNSRIADRIATGIFFAFAAIITLVLAGLLGYILFHGITKIDLHFLTSPSSSFRVGGGIGPQLFNSFYILLITMIFTIPLGLGGGIYMAEYAKPGRLTNLIRTGIEVLASIPSIVLGMFGLLVFVNLTGLGYSIISGALTLTIFNIPVMVRVCEDAINSVPKEQKEAGLALGLTHWYSIKTILIPSAFPTILTGAILASGRVFGEAAALLFTAGLTTPRLDFFNWNPFSEDSPLNIFRPAETLAVHIWAVNSEGLIPDARAVADGASAVLVISVLLFNLVARWLGSIIHKRLTSTK